MPTANLPLVRDDISLRELIDTLAQHEARGAIVRLGKTYAFVALDDIFQMLQREEGTPSTEVRIRALQHNDIIGGIRHNRVVSARQAFARIVADTELAELLSAPMYVCPRGDQVSSNPGVCSFHNLQLISAQDDQ